MEVPYHGSLMDGFILPGSSLSLERVYVPYYFTFHLSALHFAGKKRKYQTNLFQES
jgi:hypothetical protein